MYFIKVTSCKLIYSETLLEPLEYCDSPPVRATKQSQEKLTSAEIRNTRKVTEKTSYKSRYKFWGKRVTEHEHSRKQVRLFSLPHLSICTSPNRTQIYILLRHFPDGSVKLRPIVSCRKITHVGS